MTLQEMLKIEVTAYNKKTTVKEILTAIAENKEDTKWFVEEYFSALFEDMLQEGYME